MVLTLFNLENSRAFRVHWLACELNLSIESRNYERMGGKKAVPELAKESGYKLGKSPCIQDGEIKVVESANCMMYLVEKYGPQSDWIPSPPNFAQRTKVIGWMDFSETIMTHALAIIYAQWFAEEQKEAIQSITEKASVNVQKDLDEIESTLDSLGGPFICGKRITAADLSLAFSCEYVLTKQIGTQGHPTNWPKIHQWLRMIEARPAYQKALKEGPRYDFCLLKNEGKL